MAKLPNAPAHVSDDFSNIEGAPVECAPVEEVRVRIILEDNKDIPPTGQFIGVNGRGYMLKPGEAANVPESIIEVLDNAVESYPVTDAEGAVIAYRDKLRFPYRIVTEKRVRT